MKSCEFTQSFHCICTGKSMVYIPYMQCVFCCVFLNTALSYKVYCAPSFLIQGSVLCFNSVERKWSVWKTVFSKQSFPTKQCNIIKLGLMSYLNKSCDQWSQCSHLQILWNEGFIEPSSAHANQDFTLVNCYPSKEWGEFLNILNSQILLHPPHSGSQVLVENEFCRFQFTRNSFFF